MRDPAPPRRSASGIVSGYVLRLCRESTVRTQAQFAEDTGVDLATVQGWESGRRPLANIRAGVLLDLKRRLPALGADPGLVQMLDAAMDADRIISLTLEPSGSAREQPLAQWVHTRATAHMIAWAVNATPPPLIAARPTPRRRGAVPTAPLLPAQDRTTLFARLRDAAETAHLAGPAEPLLRRQALYLTSHDRSPDASAWTTHALHSRRGVLSIRGWSPTWAEGRSVATALARQGDPQPLLDFIDRALTDDDRGEAANLNYWAYWLGASNQPQSSDTFMAAVGRPDWDPITLLRMLTQGLEEAPTYVELYAHSLWALLEAHPWLPLAAPMLSADLADRIGQILDSDRVSPRSRREFAAVHYRLTNRT